MLKTENLEVVGVSHAIRGMRNPMNSWDKSDSFEKDGSFIIGENDYKLMKNLCKAGTDHRKFMRMIVVYVDITAPLYWWKEFDTYKVGTVCNSCSTMHKIADKEFTLEDFSHEHLMCQGELEICWGDWIPRNVLEHIIRVLNKQRDKYLEYKSKKFWWQMIQLLPSSYNQKRTIMLNYEVLSNIFHSRKNHKLDEWIYFCDKIKELPASDLITGNIE
ncbi:MAG: hypothetical protein R3Y12_04180 [Clostridia bacterium]